MITNENVPNSWTDLEPGTEISDKLYYAMLNILPPVMLRRSPYLGFQVGEAYDHQDDKDGRWRARYMTFVQVNNRYYYAGLQFGGECDWRCA